MNEQLGTRESLTDIAVSLIGAACIRYIPGHPELGQSSDGFDCSGFVGYVLRLANLEAPQFTRLDGRQTNIRHTNEYFDHYGVAVHEELRKAGDLVFFSKHGWSPTHMGIMVSKNAYVHAPGYDGLLVQREVLQTEPIEVTDLSSHRRLYLNNPIGFKSPVQLHPASTYRVHQEALK